MNFTVTVPKLLTLCAAAASCSIPANAALIYDADFSGSEGVTHTTSSPAPSGPHSVAGPNWTFSYTSSPASDTSANFARAAGDRFETEDWGGEAQVVSSEIDVSGIDSVDIAWVGQTVGSSVFNSGTERFEWLYSLDMGSAVQVASTTSDGSLNRTVSALDVSGASTLEVGFLWQANGAGDGFDLFSMTVEGEPVPEPASFLLIGTGVIAVAGRRARHK